ncbi:MAG: hypothetical protein D6784_14355 [Chloroflexi bacterium]|nr:MAG: hypothetical protein D6784_14355 [Chloroflexota bacterium]
METAKKLNWVLVVLGAWQIVASLIFGYWNSTVAIVNAIIVGLLMAGLALLVIRRDDAKFGESIDWAIAAVALWLLISPFALSFNKMVPIAGWNDPIVGLVSLVLALRSVSLFHKLVPSEQ